MIKFTPGSISIYKTLMKKQDGEQLLKQPMVELLTLRADCSLLALKPAHSSSYLPFSTLTVESFHDYDRLFCPFTLILFHDGKRPHIVKSYLSVLAQVSQNCAGQVVSILQLPPIRQRDVASLHGLR